MDRKIIVAGFIIAGSGVVNAVVNQKPITPIIIGAYVFVLVLALSDAFGGPVQQFADSIAMLAVVYVLLAEFPWNTIIAFVQGKKV